ncbi:MAG TPA: hypothetical protein VFU46_09000 [Gemmatimonadales bacterium]|nr:hypothetical protein [Gemmatimonadales bacterium]
MARERRVSRREPAPATLRDWLERHTAAAPEALRVRVLEYAAPLATRADFPAALAAAGDEALARALSGAGDRSVALDLLAADALITLALLAQAEQAPDALQAFAASRLRVHLPTR